MTSERTLARIAGSLYLVVAVGELWARRVVAGEGRAGSRAGSARSGAHRIEEEQP